MGCFGRNKSVVWEHLLYDMFSIQCIYNLLFTFICQHILILLVEHNNLFATMFPTKTYLHLQFICIERSFFEDRAELQHFVLNDLTFSVMLEYCCIFTVCLSCCFGSYLIAVEPQLKLVNQLFTKNILGGGVNCMFYWSGATVGDSAHDAGRSIRLHKHANYLMPIWLSSAFFI